MGDYQHGQPALRQIAHDGQHLAHHFRVQGRGGFVKEQNFRVHCQRPGNGHPLLLPAGKLAGPGIAIGCHAYLVQIIQRFFLGLLLPAMEHQLLPADAIGKYCHIGKQIEGLKHHAHMAVIIRPVQRFGIFSAIENLPGGGLLQKIDAAQQRAFSGARGADDGNHFALAHRKGNIPQHLQIPKAFLQMPDLQQRFPLSQRAHPLS